MVTMGVFPFQGKTHMVEPGIEPGTSWLVVRRSDHQATSLVRILNIKTSINYIRNIICKERETMLRCEILRQILSSIKHKPNLPQIIYKVVKI